ncbi:DUF1553 domain-containing protein [Singulisphaera sp. Ch08]|uniref:DUF1553 domain-containing protein n=1 Tax=Singulisphaera sp. Ch08 TaxID=3120278 RepID=A0AAU7C8Q4_9BACT
MNGFSNRSAALLSFVLIAWAGPACCAAGLERVAIWEKIPATWDWQVPERDPDDSFEVASLGFVRLPAKYNTKGIETDRSAPFAVHAEATLKVEAGPHRLILRSRGAARLLVDGKVLAETKPIKPNGSGHENVPEVLPPEDVRWRYVGTGDQEAIVPWTSDGASHRVELWAVIGHKKLRPETGELSVSVVGPGGVPVLVGGAGHVELTDAGWSVYADSERVRLAQFDTDRRRVAARTEDPFWNDRHAVARREAERLAKPVPAGVGNLVDRFVQAERGGDPRQPSPPLAADAAFFRRLALDTIGVVPAASEVEAFLADTRPDKRARAIDDRLADPRWADGWMGYWQDVLAENPGILKPTLNNTGPFRRYLHGAFLDNTAFDRFATELIRMEGSALGGGPAGFAIASENDAPMAAKAHVLAKAFLAADMKCARCHDAPFHPYEQSDLFGIAAMLAGKSLAIPATSTVQAQEGGRPPTVSVTLRAGDKVPPRWNLPEVGEETLPDGFIPKKASSRERLAALITSPWNSRFAPVIANRLWKRYLGVGLVEPVDDWDNSPSARSPELLEALGRELMVHDYDLKHLARLILNSRVYQEAVQPAGIATDTDSNVTKADPLPLVQTRRKMSAEQLVDSMFAVVGKSFGAEELNLDPDGRRPPTEFLNLGMPRRAWEFTSTSNERDRPALSLPVVQSLVDVLQTFGWRPSRQDPITDRDEAITPLQPALLANGIAANRVVGLSDDSAITELCLKDQTPEALIRAVTLRVLSRPPTGPETERLVAYLGATYNGRIVPGAKPNPLHLFTRRVSWSNHLSPEATTIQLEREKAARAGDPPTNRLTVEFRERMEDVVWALINSPEFVFLP